MMMDALLTLLNVASVGLLVSAVMCRLSRTYKFYFKSAMLYLIYFLTSLVSVPYGFLHMDDPWRVTQLTARVAVWLSEHTLGATFRVECEDPVSVDKGRGYVIVCNHQSSMDAGAIHRLNLSGYIGPTSMMIKKSLLYVFPVGLMFYLMGAVFIDRSSQSGRSALNEAGRRAKEKGASLFLFPEGTRNHRRDLNMLPFKKGGFHVALDAGLPILPVVVSQYEFYDVGRKRFDCGECLVKVLKPIETEGYGKDDMDKLVEATRERMVEELRAISSPSEKKLN